MKNHAMLEADDKEKLPLLSKNANKEKHSEHLHQRVSILGLKIIPW
jgi:hypothetical protein